jgi:quercetin dioxygenase-like cupin family protein
MYWSGISRTKPRKFIYFHRIIYKIMKQFKYPNLKTALGQVMKEDRDYILVKHNFPAGEVVGEHFHPSVDEWAFFDSGSFEATIDFEKEIITAGKGASAIYFPKAHIHGLKCITNMSYLVLREGNDQIIYLDELINKMNPTNFINDPCGMLWELYKDENMSLAYVRVTGPAKKHKHKIMQEKYRTEKGSGELQIGNDTICLPKGSSIEIPKNEWHYLRKATENPFEILVLTHPGYIPEDFIAE